MHNLCIATRFNIDLQRITGDTVGRGLVARAVDDGDNIPQFEAAMRGHGDAGTAGVQPVTGQDGGCGVTGDRGRGYGDIVADVEPLANEGGLGRRDGVAGNVATGRVDADHEGTVDLGGIQEVLGLKDGMDDGTDDVGPCPPVVDKTVKRITVKHSYNLRASSILASGGRCACNIARKIIYSCAADITDAVH